MPAPTVSCTWTAASTRTISCPTWQGHSIGWWEGDTLVVDTVGYNDKFWFDRRGTPHTEQLHTIERYTRLNYGTLANEVTLEDPGALSRPVQLKFRARLMRPDRQTGVGDLMEFICNEDNQVRRGRQLPARLRGGEQIDSGATTHLARHPLVAAIFTPTEPQRHGDTEKTATNRQ